MTDDWMGGHAAPVLDTPGKRLFRTMIVMGAKTGAAFANHYRVAAWGCGTACADGALIDTRSGQVIPIPRMNLGFEVKPDSRLLILSPFADHETVAQRKAMAVNVLPTYYVLQGRRLEQICTK
ncbi:hypothetical protein Q0M94_03550 [Deinococcus radiomollis]|uniref:hypothetical protein n=1 Tax=Deinococcus radiomollis TaxID=468916 RepID=UPI00389213A4